MLHPALLVACVALLVASGIVVWRLVLWLVRRRRTPTAGERLQRGRRTFHLRREWLEARFLTLASRSGKPRGLAWVDCDFEDGVEFARERATGQLRALVGVAIRFRAVEGGGMEDNPNVPTLRAATAVFFLDDDEWETDGRTLFNLNPKEAIRHFQHELEIAE